MKLRLVFGASKIEIMSQAVKDILDRIDHLTADDRAELDRELAIQFEAEWKREAELARAEAERRGIDQAAIDRAIEELRYPR